MADKTKVGIEFPLYTFDVEKESTDHVKLIY